MIVNGYNSNHKGEDWNKRISTNTFHDFIEFSQDGCVILGTSGSNRIEWDGFVRLFENINTLQDNFEKPVPLIPIDCGISDAKFLLDNNKFVVAGDSGAFRVVQANGPYLKIADTNFAHSKAILCVELFSDKVTALTCGVDLSIKVWDSKLFVVSKSYQSAHSRIITSVAPHLSKQTVFVSTSLDGNLLLWDTKLVKPATLISMNTIGQSACCWTDENHVVAGDFSGYISLYDIRSNKKLDGFQGSDRKVHRLKYNSDLQCFAACFDDQDLRVFNSNNGVLNEMYNSSQHKDFVRGLAWKDNTLYTCGYDGLVLAHNVSV